MSSMNKWADFWRYQIGVNVIPANTKDKKPLKGLSWEQWQNSPIPEELHKQWKQQNAFSNGIAIIPGRVWHRNDRQDQYFTFLDADKQKSIDELCSRNGKTTTLQEMAQEFIVEQHNDNLQKAHIYFYSPIPFPKKSADYVLGLEVKGLGEHGLAYCANSIHKDGQPYEIIGTTNPITLTADQAKELIEHIDQICKKYNLEYLEKHYRNLLDSDAKIHIGERHTSLISIANSLLFRYGGNGNSNGNGNNNLDPQLEQELKSRFLDISNSRCEVPLPASEINQIWKDAVAYYTKKKKEVGIGDQSYKDEDDKRKPASDTDQESTALRALRLAEDQCDELFHDQFNAPYAAIQVGDHTEVLPLKSSRFRNWLSRLYYGFERDVLSSETGTNVINVLKAKAEFEGRTRKLNLRVTSIKEEEPFTIYYDLTGKDWFVIKITKDGWDTQDAPIIFRRYSNQLPQVYPHKQYSPDIFDRFMNLMNVKGEDNQLLLRCYIISLFYPEIPKPVLMLHGEQGSAKSTLQELIRMLVDPSSISTLTFPRDINELVQKLSHNYVAYFDNVSIIHDWISDQLCRAVTGSGFSKRELYTDDDDIIYNFKRCIGFNGINLGATKADLLDRGIIIELDRISREKQCRLENIWAEFDGIKPELLGYIFDTLVKVLQVKSSGGIAGEIKGLPRMADFAEIGEIISRCMGYENNKFLDAYYRNIDLQVEEAIASNHVGTGIVKLMDADEMQCPWRWKGTMSELLAKLEQVADILKINRRSKSWPKAPNSLSRRINEIKTNLREIGIVIDNSGARDSKTKVKTVEIRKVSLIPLPSLPGENRAQIAGDIGNDIDSKGTIISSEDKISLPKTPKNHAQNDTGNDSDDGNDILHTLQGQYSDYPPICYYCDYKPYSKDDYEAHVIMRHGHSLAYPNKAEIEKLGLEAQRKNWET
jgi:hypothetical protein